MDAATTTRFEIPASTLAAASTGAGMGHSSLETTMGYLHAESLSVNSPLETVLGGKLQRPIQNVSTANEK